MSDSLTRLLLRAQGAPPSVEPLLPSRYAAPEPAPWEQSEPRSEISRPAAAPEALDATGRHPEPAAAISPNAPMTMPAASEPVEPLVSSATTAAAPLDAPPGSRNVAPAALPPEQPMLLRTAVQSPEDSSPEDSSPVIAPVRIARAAPPLSDARHEPTHPAGAFATEIETPDLARMPSRPERMAGPEPRAPSSPLRAATNGAAGFTASGFTNAEVRISIGRVEVHTLPPPPRAVRQVPPRRPTVSLADYLARRGGRAP